MKRLALLALLALASAGSAIAAGTEPIPESVQTIKNRIDQSLGTGDEAPTSAEPLSIEGPSTPISGADASLLEPVGPHLLHTTLDPVGIQQRIDKGVTAAGEDSAFQPDYAFGAFQRGWFLTAFSLAIDRARAGDSAAQTLLGVLLSRGLGVKQDLPAAADWYRLAGDAGDPEALYALGQQYLDGDGVPQNPTKAAELFRKAADAGHAVASRELGYLLLQGNGAKKDAMLAAAFLRRAAGLGDMDAEYTLAGLYVDGIGVVADEKQAARWFAEAARNGHIGAQVEYAIILFNGEGVAKNQAEAVAWFTRAAEADNPVAQLRLSRVLAEGLGVSADSAASARWYLIAKSHGLEDDTMEDRLKRLDPEALKAAQTAADDWARLRAGAFQPTLASAPAPAPVDKQTE